MLKPAAAVLVALSIAHAPAVSQVSLSGQTAAHFARSAATTSQRTLNQGRPTFGWQLDLFIDGQVTDDVSALSTVRVADDQTINFDYLAVRLTDLTPLHLTLHAGKFDLPFGNLGDRRYPRRNPLFGFPLIYEYRTALPEYQSTEAALLSYRGRGRGLRLLDLGMYDIGAMVSGSWEVLDYAFAVTNGTISSSSYGNPNSNSDLGKVARLQVTPLTGLTIGAAYAWGAYLEESGPQPARPIDVNTYIQKSAELDLEFSRGHVVLNGEVVYNTWPVPFDTRDENLNVTGVYAEGRYTLFPRLYCALRMSGLRFGKVVLRQVEQRWDYDVDELEAGLGYFIDRDVLLKLVRRETRTYGGSDPKDNLTVLQLAVAY